MTDDKIEPLNFSGGVNVVDIGDMRVKRGRTYRPLPCCVHRKLVYDNVERRVWCEHCQTDVDAFDAFETVVGQIDAWEKCYKRKVEQLNELQQKQIHRIGAANLQKEWQKKNTIPCCPHCDSGLLGDDFKGEIKRKSKELEMARRKAKKDNV